MCTNTQFCARSTEQCAHSTDIWYVCTPQCVNAHRPLRMICLAKWCRMKQILRVPRALYAYTRKKMFQIHASLATP